MADIELVIKIPEIEYEHIANKEKFNSLEKSKQEWLINKTLNRVIDGTPLPNILDKIRAELHSTAEMHEDGVYYLRDEWIDEYFDKYKAESEVEK